MPGIVIAFLVIAFATTTCHAVTIDWATVGNPGNTANTTGYGAVADSYRIAKFDVTVNQYTEFLNAVAATDTYSLYNASMATDLNIAGIARAGSSGSYTYSVIGSSGNKPITYVSWFDAARFANWMHNGQGSGSTETGAYTLGGATSGQAVPRNAGASFYLPTENQWYKAAYYSPTMNSGAGGYWKYATQSNTVPGNVAGPVANQVNYFNGVYSATQSSTYSASQNYLRVVGAFYYSNSYYGTFDQNGNVYQWTDSNGAPSSFLSIRGGSWFDDAYYLSSANRNVAATAYADSTVGFRLASPVSSPAPIPEIDPAGMGSVIALVTGALGLFERRRRRT